MAVPIIETNNTLKFPSGPDYQLVVGEGDGTSVGKLYVWF